MMKNNTFILFFIIIIGLAIRICNLDKPEGLWNDEYIGWYIAQQENISTIFSKMVTNCHMPLYYFYLKLWIFLFGDTDTILRWSSITPSVLAIIPMYLIGKEIKDEKLGLFTAFLTAISSFLIYFSQELRLYGLIFLISSIVLLATIKIIKLPTQKNLNLYIISNIFLILTHTFGIIYTFFNIIFLIIHFLKNDDVHKEIIIKYFKDKKIIIPISLIFIFVISFIFYISSKNILSQFWSEFSFGKILFTLTDYFSPIQINIVNTPTSFINYVINENSKNYSFIIFGILPTIIAIYAIYKSYRTNLKQIKTPIYIFTAYMLCIIGLSVLGKIILLTKYTMEIYPILLMLVSLGLLSIEKEKIKNILIYAFIIINLSYLLLAPEAVQNRTRPEGHRAVAELLKNSRLKENDYVLLTYYDKDRFERYLKNAPIYNFYSINKFNFNQIMFNGTDYKNDIENGKILYKNQLKEFPQKNIINYVQENFDKKMNKGDRIGIIFLNNVSLYSNNELQKIIENKKDYKEKSFIFLVFSSLRNNILYSFKDNFKIDSITQSGDWTLFVYEKIK